MIQPVLSIIGAAIVIIAVYSNGYQAGRVSYLTCPELHDQLLKTEAAHNQCKKKLEERK